MNSEVVKNRFDRTAAQSLNKNIATITARALLTTFILLLLSASSASATCVAPYDDMVINSSTVLCGGDYFINDAGANGVIIIDGNGFTLDGNGSVIHGTGNAGIINTAGNGNNVILKNVTFSGYATGASITVVDSIKIQDSNFTGNSNNIYFSSANNSEILNTTISKSINDEGLKIENSKKVVIKNNTITQNKASGIYFSGTTDSLIDGNDIINNNDGLVLVSSSDNNIINNIIDYGLISNDHGIKLLSSSNDVLVKNNTIKNMRDHGILIDGSLNSIIYYNVLINNGASVGESSIYLKNNTDSANVSKNEITGSRNIGIKIDSSSSANMINANRIIESAEYGIYVDGDSSDNNNITSNTIKGASIAGIYFANGPDAATIYNNTITKSTSKTLGYGIRIGESHNNILCKNNVRYASYIGLYFDNYPTGNDILYNFIRDSTQDDFKIEYRYLATNNNISINALTKPFDCPYGAGNICEGNIISNLIVDDEPNPIRDYSKIQDAIDAATENDDIYVFDGTYHENVNINKKLYLHGPQDSAPKPIVDAGGTGSALTLTSDGITLERFVVTNATGLDNAGIKINSNNSLVRYNNITNNSFGIWLRPSADNNISSNEIIGNKWTGFYFENDSYYNSIVNNTVNGDNYYHYTNTSNLLIENLILNASNVSNLGKISLINCTGITLRNLTLANNNASGIFLHNSGYNTIIDNNASSNNKHGIHLNSSFNNILKNNNISNNTDGIYLDYSTNNTIKNNNANSNNNYGIYLFSSNSNNIYLNNFIDNTASFSNSINNWNLVDQITYSYNGATYTNNTGNYWSDYTGNDANNDGIGDSPYPIIGDNDNYPLIQPHENYDTTPPATTLYSLTPDPTSNNIFNYTGIAVDETTNIISVEYRIQWGNWISATPVDGVFDSPTEEFEFTTSPLSDGTYFIEVRSTDASGHIENTYASDTITIDSGTPPTLVIAYPTPTSTTGTNTTLIASTNEPATLKYDFVDVNYTQMNYTFSSTGLTTHTTLLSNLPAGSNTVYVGAADLSGNINNTTANVTWIVDASGPQLSQVLINDQVTDNINSDPNIKTTITSPFSTIIAVEYFIDTVGTDGTGIAISPSGTTTQNIDLTLDIAALSDGDHTIYLHAANQMGWGGYQAAAFIIDTTPPVINIVSPQNGTTLVTPVITITGTASDASDVASVTVNGENATGTTNWDADVTLIDGKNNITIVSTDDLGNTQSVVLTVYYNPSAVIISMGSAEVPSNSLVTIPVSIANAMNITGISFDLFYNSSVASVDSIVANSSFTGSSVSSNVDNINGTTRVVLTNTDLISTSTQTPVIDVTFNITGDFGSLTNLDLDDVELSNSEFNPDTPASVVDGLITVGINGDLNNNGYVDIGDVAKVAFMVAGKVPEELSADFNDNGYVDIGDAAKIAFYLAGKVSEL